ncbi:predicted protein [Nematostella vectensis]|uniref:Aquaporin n=1 Tax=Nematostella vectensis TaxID=45351 RepID=A7SKN0_NEMVE|nr:uncharacterized protein LOC5525261 [Nematostella vectensis]EDO35733.1 predicted protein [Nematostella vectensis]|eukprot:XP_001647522.1 predicted protein [Nematostella vectensis]
MDILWSVAAIIVVFLLGEIGRMIVKTNMLPRHYKYASELISSFQFSACIFELVVIGRFYSPYVGIACSFILLFLKNSEYIFDGSAANPCGLLEGVVCKLKKPWFLNFVLTVLFQFSGALLSFPVMRFMWQKTNSEMHFKQLNSELGTTLQVPIIIGFAIEVFTTFVVTMVDFVTRGEMRRFNPILRSTTCIAVCYALTGTTGVWMNPVFATVHTFLFTTGKELLLEHLFVFWVGPILGTLVAIGIDFKTHKHEVQKPKPIARTIKKHLQKNSTNGRSLKQRNSRKLKQTSTGVR